MSTFQTTKGPGEVIDYHLDFSEEFAKDNPDDQLDSTVWAVTRGDVSIDSDRIEGTALAIARVSGGTKLHTWHAVTCTATTVSGQVYVRTIDIQLVRA